MSDFYAHTTDGELFQLVKDGDIAAFREIYDRYWKLLFYMAEKKLRGFQDSEEIVQDIFADLWLKKSAIDLQYSLKSFLAGMAKFKIYTKLSQQYRRQMQTEDTACTENILTDISVEDVYQIKELREEIFKAVNELPERCQLIYKLSREEGLSYKQIAAHLHLSEKTVETQMSRALKRLRAAFGTFISMFL